MGDNDGTTCGKPKFVAHQVRRSVIAGILTSPRNANCIVACSLEESAMEVIGS
jgi:hypothetical protein